MNLLPFLVLVFLISTVVGQSIGNLQEIDPDFTGHLPALFNKDKIVGGSVAEPGEIPWQAFVDVDFCGAAILNEFWLLSAAHCFTDLSHVGVTVGEYNLSQEDPGQQSFKAEIIKHDQFNIAVKHDYDFALLKIKPSKDGKGIQFNKFVQAIQLPVATSSLKDGTPLLISGWGHTIAGDASSGSPVLKKALVPYINQETCKHSYTSALTDRMFCAGYPTGGTDACQNDSGGPVAYERGGQYTLFGIVSWGYGCAQPNNPGVYARVTSVLPWIENIMAVHR